MILTLPENTLMSNVKNDGFSKNNLHKVRSRTKVNFLGKNDKERMQYSLHLYLSTSQRFPNHLILNSNSPSLQFLFSYYVSSSETKCFIGGNKNFS